MFEIGRVCLKTAGRDAGGRCVVLDVADNKVLIDGEVRRRLISSVHLEPTSKLLDVERNASHEQVAVLFKKEFQVELPVKRVKVHSV